MRVDFPAPFSPMIPWIVPWDIFIEMSLLAFTGPKDFEISTSSIEEAASSCRLFVVSCATVIPVYLTGQLESDM